MKLTAATAISVDDPNSLMKSQLLRREIEQSQIQPLYLSITSVTQTDLDALISSLDQLEVPSSRQTAVPESVSSSKTPAAEPEPQAEDSQTREPDKKDSAVRTDTRSEPEPKAPVKDIHSPRWLQRVDGTTQAASPMALADVLFRIGQLDRAERFYRQVLETLDSPEEADWQWAMYQRANCLRRSHPALARDLYQELIQKAPSCSWSAAAGVQKAVLGWYEEVQSTNLTRFLGDPNELP